MTPPVLNPQARRRQRTGKRRDPQLNTQARRRMLAQVRAEEPLCHLCSRPIDLTLDKQTHPMGSTVDELLPRSKGGSALERANCRHAHRICQTIRGVKPITPELKAAITARTAVPANGTRRTLSAAW